MFKISKKTKKTISYILRIILFLFISIVLGFSIYSWNIKTLKGDVLPMPFGYGIAVVLTGSMEPNLSENDMIIIKKTNDYKVDDIVVFQDQYTLVVHRIIRIEGEYYITKGDNNDAEDSPIKLSLIKGEVIKDYSSIGAVIRFIKTPIGIVMILGLAASLLFLSYRKEKDDDKEKLKNIKEEIIKLKNEIYK